jgi:hypothetical protein
MAAGARTRAGAYRGGAGGGRRVGELVAGAALGLLLPIADDTLGHFLFYMAWQAGYAAVMATAFVSPNSRGESYEES